MDLGIAFQVCSKCGTQSVPPEHYSKGRELVVEMEIPVPRLPTPDEVRNRFSEQLKGFSKQEIEEFVRETIEDIKRARNEYIKELKRMKFELHGGEQGFKKFEEEDLGNKIRIRAERHESVIEGSEESGYIAVKCPVCGHIMLEWRRE
jgi:hypothetical protein